MSTNRKKLFIENFLAYGAINALDKIVPLIMLPIVTRMLTDTADYGRFDMFNTIVSFGSSFAILGIYDAMFREYFEKDASHYKSLVTSTAVKIVFISSIVISLLVAGFSAQISELFLGDTEGIKIVLWASLGVFLGANKAIISAPTRMKNQKRVYVFSGISYSIVYYAAAFALIKMGWSYDALIFGSLIASLYSLFFFFILNHKDFEFKLFNNTVSNELLKIGVPLVPIFVIYWAFSSMDRVMITRMLGLHELGVYSIGAKVASVSTFIYAAFAGGWQYFAFSTMKDNDQVEMTSKIFEYLGVLSFAAFAIATPCCGLVFRTFFSGDYVRGVEVFPYLFLSPLMLMLFQTAGNQLLVIKKSYLSTLCLVVGLAVNLLLNFLLIPVSGIKGAALATLLGYTSSVICVMILTRYKNLMIYSSRLCILITFTITINLFLAIPPNAFHNLSSMRAYWVWP